MSGKTLVEIQTPVTQTVDAVKALLVYMHRPAEPLPLFVALNDRVRLTLSKDKQAYYVTTANGCSCPARTYNPAKPCKHMRALEVDIAKIPREEVTTAPRRLARLPDDAGSIRPTFDKPFRPFSELPSEEKAAGAV